MQNEKNNEFIIKAIKVHGEQYGYNLINVKRYAKDKIDIICNKHGIFSQVPSSHLNGRGCMKCGKERLKILFSSNGDEFILKAELKHGKFYDYNLVEYKGAKNKVKIKCPIHGIFEQTPTNHLFFGCNKCGCDKAASILRYTKDDFINEAKNIHNDKYIYLLDTPFNYNEHMNVLCPIHGLFTTIPKRHIRTKHGCPKCSIEKGRLNNTSNIGEFITKAIRVHGDLYDYSESVYTKAKNKIIIGCKKHGNFLQTVNGHLAGLKCPACNISKGEQLIANFLDRNNINYIREYKITGYKYRYDFYLPDLEIFIEYDGIQHFKPMKIWGGIKNLNIIKKADKIKNNLVDELNCKLIRIPYTAKHYIDDYLITKLSQIYKYNFNGIFYKDSHNLINDIGNEFVEILDMFLINEILA